ncbi:MAG: hypothetical protein J0L84_18435, partial [Verrucomicrobia bacterium]|nr:hypothetical protein [Verrucomicrobiota bacterium]
LAKPPGMPWRDYLIMLLQMAAEVEHGLMVQYLFAAYSVDPERAPEAKRSGIRKWQEAILTVAREEMGHLLTVQNILCLLGGPASFLRRDFPWDTPFYPFPFRLQRLTRETLAMFVFAEMPDEIFRVLTADSLDEETLRRLSHLLADGEVPDPAIHEGAECHQDHRKARDFLKHDLPFIRSTVSPLLNAEGKRPVGEIYEVLLQIVGDPEKIPDSDFRAGSYDFQASWDDWGRGYKPPPTTPHGSTPPPGSRKSNVIILQAGTRTEALDALRQVMGQGEAPDLSTLGQGEPEASHFARFANVFREYRHWIVEAQADWQPARDVATNPSTVPDTAYLPAGSTRITHPAALKWAHLFNLRYRLLLTYLTHTFRISRVLDPGVPNARGAVMHRIFGEMYNLKSLSGILVQLPITGPGDPQRAGPPFEMPYSLVLPPDEPDCWRLYRDLLDTSLELGKSLLEDYEKLHSMPPEGREYLRALRNLDLNQRDWLDQMPGGRACPSS